MIDSAFGTTRICLHGLEAGHVRGRLDERHNAWYIEIEIDNHDLDIRISLNHTDACDSDRVAELRRDREGLRQLAAAALKAAAQVDQVLAAAQAEAAELREIEA